MKVFLKYILKSMTEKKGRFILLIFSIMVSTALFVFSLGAVDVILDGYEDTLKNAADGKEIGIQSNTADVYFDENDFDPANLTDFEGRLNAIGVINKDDKITYVTLVGKKDCSKYVKEGSMPKDSSDAVCAISDRVAKKRELAIGDSLELAVGGEKISFTVNAICAPNGDYYADSSTSFSIVVPYEYMNKLMNADGKFNYMTAVTNEKESVKAADSFNKVNERVKATSLTDLSSEKELTQSTVSTVYIMFAIVCIICCLIIHGAFKLIINERMSVIGTFMSQGATKSKIEHILLMESFMYSVFGAVFGVGLGELILYIVNRMTSPLKDYGIYMSFNVKPSLIVTGILFAVIISMISAWMPARSVRKLPVKDVILGRLEIKHKKGNIRFIAGTVLLALSIACAFVKAGWTEELGIFILSMSVIGLIMMLRKFLKILSDKLSGLFKNNTSMFLALNNVKTSKLLRANITLMVIAFTAVLTISALGKSMAEGVVNAYEKMNFDFEISNIINNNSDVATTDIIVDKLNSLDCVKKDTIMPMMNAWVKVDDKTTPFILQSADPLKFAHYNDYLELSSEKYYKYFEELENSDDYLCVVTDFLCKKTGKKAGDTIEIEVNNKKAEFKIVGSIDGKLYNNGSIIIIKPEIVKKEYNIKEADAINFDITGDAKEAEAQFKGFLADLGATYISHDDMMEENAKSNQMFVDLLGIFAIIAMLVSAIGIFNNITISFQQRRKEFAVYSSIGMNSKKRKRLVFVENMYCVLLAIAISVPYTLLSNRLMFNVLKKLNIPLELKFNWSTLPFYCIALAFIIFLASLSTMRKSKKINVVSELKYE